MKIEWKGPDGEGYLYQANAMEGLGQFNIRVPVRLCGDRLFTLFYDGDEIDKYESAAAAKAAAERHLEKLS
jgi:hypothetical protein